MRTEAADTDGKSGQVIYRAEVVGSMLRPVELVQAREKMRAGELDSPAYREIEDRAIDEALRIQEDAGLDVATDGEMRRDIFFDFFVSGMTGLSMIGGSTVTFHGHDPSAEMEVQVPFSVTDRVTAKTCPGVAELEYAQPRTHLPVKITLPSPMLLVLGFWNEHSRDVYPDPLQLARDATNAVEGWMAELIAPGCRYIQIDAPDLAEAYADRAVREWSPRDAGMKPAEFLSVATELICGLGHIQRPDHVTLGLHLCKGNGTQAWIAEGGYDALARAVFPHLDGFDVVHMEYDDERSGGFEPLMSCPITSPQRRTGLDQMDPARGLRHPPLAHRRGRTFSPQTSSSDRPPMRLCLRQRNRRTAKGHPADTGRQAQSHRRRRPLGLELTPQRNNHPALTHRRQGRRNVCVNRYASWQSAPDDREDHTRKRQSKGRPWARSSRCKQCSKSSRASTRTAAARGRGGFSPGAAPTEGGPRVLPPTRAAHTG